MFCQKCGAELEEDSVFCFNCGIPVEGTALKKQETENTVAPVKRKRNRRKSRVFIFSIVLFIIAGVIVSKFYFIPKWEEKKIYEAVEGCFEAFKQGDVETALTFTNYDEGIGLTDYLLSRENTISQNLIKNTFFSYIKIEESWKNVLDYGLSHSVRGYEIKDIQVDGNMAVVRLTLVGPDFKEAACFSADKLLEMIKNSYDAEDIATVGAGIAVACASRNPAALGDVLIKVLGPLYVQWPEQIKKDFDLAESRAMDVELELEKKDGTWIILAEEPVNAVGNYIFEVCNALLPEMNVTID